MDWMKCGRPVSSRYEWSEAGAPVVYCTVPPAVPAVHMYSPVVAHKLDFLGLV